MSEDFARLREIVLSETDLQEELRHISGEEFVSRVVAIGSERGLNVSENDVLEAMRDSRRTWIERWI